MTPPTRPDATARDIIADFVDLCYVDGTSPTWRLCLGCETEYHREADGFDHGRTDCLVKVAEAWLRAWTKEQSRSQLDTTAQARHLAEQIGLALGHDTWDDENNPDVQTIVCLITSALTAAAAAQEAELQQLKDKYLSDVKLLDALRIAEARLTAQEAEIVRLKGIEAVYREIVGTSHDESR